MYIDMFIKTKGTDYGNHVGLFIYSSTIYYTIVNPGSILTDGAISHSGVGLEVVYPIKCE